MIRVFPLLPLLLAASFILSFAAGCERESAPAALAQQSRIHPVQVSLEGSGGSHPPAWALFDRDVVTRFRAGEETRLVVSMGGARRLEAVKTFGASPYTLEVKDRDAGSNLATIDLSEGPDGAWSLHALPAAYSVRNLVLIFSAHGDPDEIADIEFWGAGPVTPLAYQPAAEPDDEATLPPNVDLLPVEPGKLTVAPATKEGAPTCGSLRFELARDPATYRRMWLRMSLDGVFRPFGLTRAFNGHAMVQGRVVPADEKGRFVQRIDPELLFQGTNELHICIPEEAGSPAEISDVEVLAELDTGSNFVESATIAQVGAMPIRSAAGLLSPTPETVTVSSGEELVLAFDRLISLDAYSLDADDASNWAVHCVEEDATVLPLATSSLGRDLFEITGGGGRCAGVRLSHARGGLVRALRFFGSGAARRIDFPQIVLTSPREHFGHEAWVEGWARAPSNVGGGVALTIEAESATGEGEGIFGRMVARSTPPTEAWVLTVGARFADGSTASRDFLLDGDGGLLPGSAGFEEVFHDGLSDQEREARYGKEGETVRGEMRPGEAGRVSLGSHVSLEVPAGAMRGTGELSITQLPRSDLPPLDPGMINVTAPFARGYEMLPHGERFQEAVTISLPYQENLLPEGYTGHDVETFFFDTASGRWERLSRVGVEAKAGKVQSVTDHFTVMINAIVVTPEHPQASAFDGNRISGLEAASPAAGITPLAPPSANHLGDAALQFPLPLPPGRLGMQPALTLGYSSSGGNGWLGVGWNLGIPAIEIDTRLGVPRYRPSEESETYLHAGERLAPTASRTDTFQKRESAEKIFRPRVEGGFERIVRRGTGPKDYHWEVTGRTGIVHRYGDPSTNPQDRGKATLRDNKNNIYRWALREIEDPHGNLVRFDYELATSRTGALTTRELYLRAIHYTLDAPAARGVYQVHFCGDASRPDPILSGRGGFAQQLSERLARIEVHVAESGQVSPCRQNPGKTQIRAFDFKYELDPFGKSQLREISQEGAGGAKQPWNLHRFDYFDEVRDGNDFQLFETSRKASIQGPAPEVGFTIGGAFLGAIGSQGMGSEVSMLGGNVSRAAGGHLYLGFNPGPPTKQLSFGMKVGTSFSQSDGRAVLVDIDGDGLPDRVSCYGGSCRYNRNMSRPGGPLTFSDAATEIEGLKGLFRDQSFDFNAGAEVHVGGGSFYGNQSQSLIQSLQYLSDVNADGFVDLIDGGNVLFNRAENGRQSFVSSSSGTSVPLGATTVRASANFDELKGALKNGSGPVDTLRLWRAERAGRVRLTGTVTRAGADEGDGFDVSVERIRLGPNGYETTRLWGAAFDRGARSQASHDETMDVWANDFLVFRLHARESGKGDRVDWDPSIRYLNGPTGVDENGLDFRRFVASEDFVLAGRSAAISVPFDGVLRIDGTLQKNGATSDDVHVEVRRKRGQLEDVVSTATLPFGSSGRVVLSEQLNVESGDQLRLFVAVDSQIDLRKLVLEVAPRVTYLSATDEAGAAVSVVDGSGAPTLQEALPFDMSSYRPLVGSELGLATWPGGAYEVRGSVSGGKGRYAVTAKSQGSLVGKTFVDHPGGPQGVSFSFPVDAAQGAIFFSVSALDPGTAPSNVSLSAFAVSGSSSFSLQARRYTLRPYADHLPRTYRGWTVTGYKPDDGGFPAPVDGLLLLDEGKFNDRTNVRNAAEGDEPEDVLGKNPSMEGSKESQRPAMYVVAEAEPCVAIAGGDPEREEFDKANPLACQRPDEAHWVGPEEGVFVTAGGMGTSLLGPDVDAIFEAIEGGSGGMGRGIVRIASGENTAFGGGIGQASIGTAFSGGVGLQDFLDLNGDGFPDIVTNDGIAYSMPHGGLGERRTPLGGDAFRDSTGNMVSVGGGASSPRSKPNGDGTQGVQMVRSADGSQSTKNDTTFGLSVGASGGSSSTGYDLIDINGDGLPDHIKVRDGVIVARLNLGYEFAEQEISWTGSPAEVHASSTGEVNLGFTAGYGKPDQSFGGGLSVSASRSWVRKPNDPHPMVIFTEGSTLLDINGDGLVDVVRPDGEHFEVRFNRGGSFGPKLKIPVSGSHDIARSETLGQSLGGYFTVGIGPLCLVSCFIIINPGANYSDSVSRPTAAVRDLDGDGRPELVTSSSPNSLDYARNRIDRTGLLRKVRRPLGATFELDYERLGHTQDMPGDRWVLSDVTIFDGYRDGLDVSVGGRDVKHTDHKAVRITYEGGRYDRYEREFLGFSRVQVDELDTTGWDGTGSSETLSVYRATKQRYLNGGLHDRGLLVESRLEDGDGRLFARTVNQYDFLDPETAKPLPPGAVQPNLLRVVPSVFPALVDVLESHHEGDEGVFIERRKQQLYDRYGNVTHFHDHGGPGGADDIVATITYSSANPTCLGAHVTAVPTKITVKNGTTLLRERTAKVSCPSPLVSSISELVSSGVAAKTDLAYDRAGRLETITYPTNHRGQRYFLTYTYDGVIGAHVASVTDAFGFTSSAAYDFRYGLPTHDVDIHGETVTTMYDAHGRASSVTGPYEQGGGAKTITYAYHPEASPPWALTSHHDQGRADRLETVRFIDGLGRDLQTKKDGTVSESGGQARDMMVASGRVQYDPFDRVVATWHPRTQAVGRQGVFLEGVDSVQATTMTFDVLDRQRTTTVPASKRAEPSNEAAVTTLAYALASGQAGEGLWAETTVTDATDASRVIRRDARGRIREVIEHGHGGGAAPTTRYAYDALDQILRVTDARGNQTVVQYDLAGRRTHISNPDAGLTEVAYDPAGNVVARITAALRGRGQRIEFHYDFTHLERIDHPGSEPDVTYRWGAQSDEPKQRGRVVQVDDAAGRVLRRYGPLGEVVSETRVLVGRHPTPAAGLTTEWTYDTWGRLRQMAYPDGEVLTYGYDSGGLVSSVKGVKLGVTYPYVDSLEYDKFGQRVRFEAGNGIVTNYDYDPTTQRLGRLEAGDFMRLDYRYDLVGNVVALMNDIQSPVPANGHGGRVVQRFTYDGLHRLVEASGAWTQPGGKDNRYTLDLTYDAIHNITSKAQRHIVETPGGAEIVQKETTYALGYAYDGGRPHAPSRVGEQRFAYDASGRMVIRHQTGGRGAPTRTLLWDSEDRVRAISDGGDAVVDDDGEVIAGRGRTTEFVYDDAGKRVFKRGAQGETAYVNQFYTLRNGTVATKHVFVGTTRISSKLVPGSAHSLPGKTDEVSRFLGRWWQHRSQSGWDHARNVEKNPHYQVVSKVPNPMGLPESNFIYFYHPDHLGSSSFVTDGGGEVYEHLQYFPFGELWADERSNTERLPYLFTGKELDQETGLYDFGARYYDPKVSVWLSPDPILASYLPDRPRQIQLNLPRLANEWQISFDLPGMGGVYESKNLALYSYAHLNPLRYRDPDGNQAVRPKYSQLEAHFPDPRKIDAPALFKSIGGKVAINGAIPANMPGHWPNTCALRVSYCLNKSGNSVNPALVPKDGSGNSQWSTGGDKEKYIFRVEALIGYLEGMYGSPDQVLTGDSRDLSSLRGKGVVIFDMRGGGSSDSYTGHATLFDGEKTLDRSDYSDQSSRILFWKLED